MASTQTNEIDGFEFVMIFGLGQEDGIVIDPRQPLTSDFIVALKEAQQAYQYHRVEHLFYEYRGGVSDNFNVKSLKKRIDEGRKLGYLQEDADLDALIHEEMFPTPPAKYTPPPKNTCGYIYLIQSASGHCKIGLSKNVEKRFKTLAQTSPVKLELVHSFYADDMTTTEKMLHELFSSKRVKNEWFELSPDDIEYIKGL